MTRSLLPLGLAPEPADWTIVHRSDPAMDVHLKLLAEQAEEALRGIRAAEGAGQPGRFAVPERAVAASSTVPVKRRRWLPMVWHRKVARCWRAPRTVDAA